MDCPECSGEMEYNSRLRKYVCRACGAAYSRDEMEDHWDDQRFSEKERETADDRRRQEYKDWYFSKKK